MKECFYSTRYLEYLHMFNSSLHQRTSYSSEFDYNEFALYAAKKREMFQCRC